MFVVAHRSLILALIASLLWPWAAAATACAGHSIEATDCCTARCCCEQESGTADPCGCCANEAPTAPTERAPASPASNAAELDRAFDLAPTIDLGGTLGASRAPARRDASCASRAEAGRSVLLRACRLRH